MNAIDNVKKPVAKDYSKGKIYQWNGQEFLELEPSDLMKVPISEEAHEAVKAIRKVVSQLVGTRVELSLVASAMLLEALKISDMPERVKQYGARIFGA